MTIRMDKFYTARIKGDDIRSFLDHVDQSEVLADSSECSESPTGAHHYIAIPRSSGGRGNNNFNCKYCGRDPNKDEKGGLREHSNEQLIEKIKEDGARFLARYDPEREWDTWNLSLMASQLISLNALVTFSVYVDDAEIESEKTELYEDMMGFVKSLRSKIPDVKIRYEIWNFKIGPAIFNPG